MKTNVNKLIDNIYYISIAKNACSTLKCLSYNINNDTIYNLNEYKSLHKYVRPYLCDYSFNIDDFNKTSDKFVFAVYRDPVDRFISAYVNMKGVGLPYTKKLIYNYNGNKNFDDFLDFAKYHLSLYNKDKYYSLDEHFRPQSYYYNYDDIDCLVKIEDLDKFLLYKLGKDCLDKYYIKKYNVTKDDRKYYINEITDEHIKQIKELYKEDYLLLEKYKDKLYDK